jgi:hypothetical protein
VQDGFSYIMNFFIKFGVVKEASRISYHEWQHELSCAGQGRRILRHNAVRDCLFDLGLKAGMTVRKEPRHLLCDGTGDKPADVLFAWFSQGRDL